MRPIKFRAYHKEEKMMCGVTVLTDEGAFLLGVKPNEGQYFPESRMYVEPITTGRFCNNDEFELMQYTGLLDKNGKEIYEGDIVKEGDKIAVVEWQDGLFTLSIYAGRPWHEIEPVETIGNIYENPGLLEDKL